MSSWGPFQPLQFCDPVISYVNTAAGQRGAQTCVHSAHCRHAELQGLCEGGVRIRVLFWQLWL